MKLLRPTSLSVRVIYALCLAGATANHAVIVLEHGLYWNYGGLPAAVCGFWTALTFLDPLALALLFAKPRAGVALTVAIITNDVMINTWVGVHYGIDAKALIAQVLFLLFVIATVRAAWGRRAGMDLHSGDTMTLGFPP